MSRYHTQYVFFFPLWGMWGSGEYRSGDSKLHKHMKGYFPGRTGRETQVHSRGFLHSDQGDASKGDRRPRPLRAPSLATHKGSGPDAPAGATHRPQCWPAGLSIGARAPARAAAARKSSLGQARSRRAEKRNMESKHRRRTHGREAGLLSRLTYPACITMQSERTSGQMRGPSCRAFAPLQKFPSFLSLAAGAGSFA